MPSRLAVDDRDRRAPVALAADQPVAQAVGDRRLGPAALGQPGDDRRAALVGRHPAEPAAVDEDLVAAWAMKRRPSARRRPRPAAATTRRIGRPNFARTRSRARRGRDGHDRARPVAGQDVVGDEDRDALAVDRVDRVGADGTPVFSRSVDRRSISVRRRAADVRLDLGPAVGIGQRRDQRVLRREDHEGRAEQGVRAGS